TTLVPTSSDPYGYHHVMLDVNGDGLMDALRVPNGDLSHPEPAANMGINIGATRQGIGFVEVTGTTLVQRVAPNNAIQGDGQYLFNEEADPGVRIADINQDGLPDIVLFGAADPGAGLTARTSPAVLQAAAGTDGQETLVAGPQLSTGPGTQIPL